MGCWNHTCAVSNLHITAGQDVVVFLLVKNHKTDDTSFCYGNALYNPVPLPFYGKYDDYGGVEDCHGFGLPIILDELKQRLYKFGQGANEYHDCEVTPENLTIEKLFEADHESRLGIQSPRYRSTDDYNKNKLEEIRLEKGLSESQQFELDRLAAKIKNEDTFQQVTHVVVHGDIFKAITEKWYIEDYVGDGKGTAGYGNNYNHIYLKDIIDSIPDYIASRKKELEELATIDGAIGARLRRMARRDSWDSPNLATKWLNGFDGGGASGRPALINVDEHIGEYIDAGDWVGLASFAKEALTFAWVNSFMSYTRKIWVKQSGQGSQNSEPLGYRVLIDAMAGILDAEKAEYDEINAEDEEEDAITG